MSNVRCANKGFGWRGEVVGACRADRGDRDTRVLRSRAAIGRKNSAACRGAAPGATRAPPIRWASLSVKIYCGH